MFESHVQIHWTYSPCSVLLDCLKLPPISRRIVWICLECSRPKNILLVEAVAHWRAFRDAGVWHFDTLHVEEDLDHGLTSLCTKVSSVLYQVLNCCKEAAGSTATFEFGSARHIRGWTSWLQSNGTWRHPLGSCMSSTHGRVMRVHAWCNAMEERNWELWDVQEVNCWQILAWFWVCNNRMAVARTMTGSFGWTAISFLWIQRLALRAICLKPVRPRQFLFPSI